MTSRQLTADQAFALLKRESPNTHVKLRTIAQTVIQTGDLPVGTKSEARRYCGNGQSTPARTPQAPSFRFVPRSRRGCERGSRECFPAARYSACVWSGSGLRAAFHLGLGIPRDI
jgi:hypothetical protein